MSRRNRTSQIPPFIDVWGRPTYDNPWGQNRPNPGLTAPIVQPAPVVQSAPVVRPRPVELIAPDPARVRRAPLQRLIHLVPTMLHTGIGDHQRIHIEGERARRLAEHRARLHRRIRRTVAVVTAVGSGFVGITAVSAYWTAHGTGNGTGSTGTLVAPTSVTATAASKLLPGGTADLSVTLTNSNSSSIKIVGISQAAGTITVTPTCTTPAVSVPTQTLSTPITVATGTHTVTIPSSLAMGVGSTNDCQNAVFTNIPIALAIQTP